MTTNTLAQALADARGREQSFVKHQAEKTIKRLKDAERAASLAQKSSPYAAYWQEINDALTIIVRARLDLEAKYNDPRPLVEVLG